MVEANDNGHILVVDDQREICDLVQEYLVSEGYRVSTAHDGAEMRRVMALGPVDLVILDLMLPGEDGLTLARSLRDHGCREPLAIWRGTGVLLDGHARRSVPSCQRCNLPRARARQSWTRSSAATASCVRARA